jgi:hypothetical protein
MGKWFRFLNKSVFEQPLGTNYVRQPRFHYTWHYNPEDGAAQVNFGQRIMTSAKSPEKFLIHETAAFMRENMVITTF